MTNVPYLRTSERRDFMRCPQRWWWAWRMGLRPRGSDADALWFGTGIHLALADWYCGPGAKRGPHPAETWEAWAGNEIRAIRTEVALDEETEAKYVDAKALGVTMLNGYVDLYGRDEHKLILAPERTFSIDVPWPQDQKLWETTPDGLLLRYVGTFDSVWRHAGTGQIWLDEHKTAAQIATGHLTLDPQAGGYWAIASRVLQTEGLLSKKDRIAGIEYNFIRKAEPDTRPRDAEGYATNKPTKQHYIDAIEAERATMPAPGSAGSWIGPPLSGKESLSLLKDIADKLGLTVLGERSKIQPAANFLRVPVHRTSAERRSQLLRLQKEGILMDALRAGVIPLTKNPDRTCNQGAFRCPFFELCEVDEAGGDVEAFIEVAFDVADPYADHRLR